MQVVRQSGVSQPISARAGISGLEVFARLIYFAGRIQLSVYTLIYLSEYLLT